MRNFNEIFRKNVTYYNILIHKKAEPNLLVGKHMFGKNQRAGVKLTPPSSLAAFLVLNGFHFGLFCCNSVDVLDYT